MILTGHEIEREWRAGRITIEPFIPEQVNPNSYNFRLGRVLRVYRQGVLDARARNEFDEIEIPDEGYVLTPGRLYLAHTIEVLGSDYYAPTFAARSSVARLGVFINLSASLGDIGYRGEWTLQLFTMNRVRVYPGINIGQMMWWRPSGKIVLYHGKYQGAVGPRTSDIHIDFDKQIARQRMPSLYGSVKADSTGAKFAALAAHAADFPVPPAVCVPAEEFVRAVTPEHAGVLADAFSDLRATVGAFLTETTRRIAGIAAQVRLPDELRRLVRVRLADYFDDPDRAAFAVRSSGLDEDTGSSSLAGVHSSVLRVRGVDGVLAAVEDCWRSHYAPAAVAARVRAGDFDWQPRLAVIVQEQIEPHLAGVAFTDGGDVAIEYVHGMADGLVAGVDVPVRVTARELIPAGSADGARRWLPDVVALARALRGLYDGELDVEWAVDDRGVNLIQVRPQTARTATTHDDAPVVRAHRLYTDDLPPDTPLGEVAAVYASYVAKRGPAYRMAAASGVPTGRGWVLRFNGRALHDTTASARLQAMLAEGVAEECVLDLADTMRQIVVPTSDVVARLVELTGVPAAGTRLHAAVVRDFLRGELGLITRLAGDGLVVEYTDEGLMALNRGTAGARTIVVKRLDGAVDDENVVAAPGRYTDLLRPHVGRLGAFTREMAGRFGDVTLEWVFAAGQPHFVDYSVLGGDQVTVGADGTVLISAGTARGHVLRLEDDEVLRRLSIGPAVSIDRAADLSEHDGLARIVEAVAAAPQPVVIRARRPYAVLSVLIGHVTAFVFDEGSTLGHLPILLREAGVPAVAYGGPDLVDGCEIVISDGTLSFGVPAGRDTDA